VPAQELDQAIAIQLQATVVERYLFVARQQLGTQRRVAGE
jgi:hypothetical protein